MTVLCVILGLIAQPIAEKRRKDRIFAEIAALGGHVAILARVDQDWSLGRIVLGFFDDEFTRRSLYGVNLAGTALNDTQLSSCCELDSILRLNLSGTRVTDQGLKALSQQVYLESLDVCDTAVSDLSLPVLQRLERLASLRVTDSKVTYSALEQLDQELPYGYFCEERAIAELTSAGVHMISYPRVLQTSEHEFHLSVVTAGSEAIRAHFGVNHQLIAAEEVALLNHLPSLQMASFNYATFSPGSLTQLEPLTQLDELDFNSINLSDADLQSLGKQVQLQHLTINNCDQITDDGLAHLQGLKNLTKLSIEWCAKLTPEALSELRAALPGCECKFGQ